MKTLIVDDHSLIRVYLKHYLHDNFPSFSVEIISSILPSLPDDIVQTQAELIILDISLEELDILDYFKELKSRLPNTFFIIYTMHNIASYKKFFWKNGASAYVLKEDAESELKEVIEAVIDGKRVFPELDVTADDDFRLNQLTFSQQEIQLLAALLETIDTKEICDRLNCSKKEVLELRKKLLTKSGAQNTQQLVNYAIDYNWIR